MLVKNVKEGTTVQCYGFRCISDGAKRTIYNDPGHGLYFGCEQGKHFLSLQLSEDGTEYIGLMEAEP